LEISCIEEKHFKIKFFALAPTDSYTTQIATYTVMTLTNLIPSVPRKCHKLFIRIGCGRVP